MSDLTAEPNVIDRFFLDAMSPDHRDDPTALYRTVRASGPVHSADGLHLVVGHPECWSILRDPATSNDERRSRVFQEQARSDPRLAAAYDTAPLLVFMDPPEHTRLRATVAAAFTPRRVAGLRRTIERIATECVDRMLDGGEADAIEHLASPLPIAVICELLGVPLADRSRFGAWSAALAKSIDPHVLRTEADDHAIDEATRELRAYTDALLAERRADRRDDLISDLVSGHDPATMPSDEELADLVTLLLAAGHETTVGLIGNGLHALLGRPDQLAAWPKSADRARPAVDELLRFDPPLQFVQRIATTEVELGDRTVAAGDLVVVALGAANRDPAAFEDPDDLDIARANSHLHVSFGGGIHHCLGAALARLEGAIAITTLLAAAPNLRATGDAPLRDTFNLRGRARLPVTLR